MKNIKSAFFGLAASITASIAGAQDNSSYSVQQGDRFNTIAMQHHISPQALQRLNPEIDIDKIGINDAIILPTDNFEHTVKKGETLTQIGQKYGVTLRAIAVENNIKDSAILKIGQNLTIPQEHINYAIKAGDTFSKIANKHGLSISTLTQANAHIDDLHNIQIGTNLHIPTGYYTHKIKPGQTLSHIAHAYHIPSKLLQKSNPQIETKNLQIGQIIRIPSPEKILEFTIPEERAKTTRLPASCNIPETAIKNAWNNTIKQKVIDPVNANDNDPPLIVIDLGHGAFNTKGIFDNGAGSDHAALNEIQIVDAIGRSLYDQIKDLGLRVALTRDSGKALLVSGNHGKTLKSRTDLAINLEREIKAPYTIFISLHVNSAAGTAGEGFEIKTPRSQDSIALKTQSKSLGLKIEEHLKQLHNTKSRKVQSDKNLKIFREFARRSFGNDAAILVEVDFLNNKPGVQRLQEVAEKPYKVARAIVKGIETYIAEKQPKVSQAIEQTAPEQTQLLCLSS